MAATTKDGLLLDRKILRKQPRSARDTIGSLRSELAEARAERDEARRERDERPAISREDARAWKRGKENASTWRDEDGQKRVIEALRAHAAGSGKVGDDG